MEWSLFVVMIIYCAGYVQRGDCVSDSVRYWQTNLPMPIPATLAQASPELSIDTLNLLVSQVIRGRISQSDCSLAGLYCDLSPGDPCFYAALSLRLRYSYSFRYRYIFGLASRCDAAPSNPPVFFPESVLSEPTGYLNVSGLVDQYPPRSIIPRTLSVVFPPLSGVSIPLFFRILGTTSNSSLGGAMEITLASCGDGCISSLEELVDLGTSYKNLFYNEIGSLPIYNAVVVNISEVDVTGKDILTCHPQMFPYVVLYCHKINVSSTRLYKVSVSGYDGYLFAVCHLDTSKWDPEHVAFKELNSAPGKTDACHFIPQNNMVWY